MSPRFGRGLPLRRVLLPWDVLTHGLRSAACLCSPAFARIPSAFALPLSRMGAGWRLCLYPAPCGFRQRPTLPGRLQPSTISAWRLNFCVRYGNRWDPPAIVTGNCMLFSIALARPRRLAGLCRMLCMCHSASASLSFSPLRLRSARLRLRCASAP